MAWAGPVIRLLSVGARWLIRPFIVIGGASGREAARRLAAEAVRKALAARALGSPLQVAHVFAANPVVRAALLSRMMAGCGSVLMTGIKGITWGVALQVGSVIAKSVGLVNYTVLGLLGSLANGLLRNLSVEREQLRSVLEKTGRTVDEIRDEKLLRELAAKQGITPDAFKESAVGFHKFMKDQDDALAERERAIILELRELASNTELAEKLDKLSTDEGSRILRAFEEQYKDTFDRVTADALAGTADITDQRYRGDMVKRIVIGYALGIAALTQAANEEQGQRGGANSRTKNEEYWRRHSTRNTGK